MLFSFMSLLLAVSCMTISRQQRSAVEQFAGKTAEFAQYPESIMSELAEIRQARGVYYASSYSDPVLHIQELDNIAGEKSADDKIPGKVGVTFKVLENYALGLQQLSSDKPIKAIGDDYQKLGKDLEDLVERYNALDGTTHFPEGIGTLLTLSADKGTHLILARKQCKKLKSIVSKADTLVSVVCVEMERFLDSDGLKTLIRNEETGITESFRFYYARQPLTSIDSERDYIALKKRIESVKVLRKNTILTTQHLKKAHRKLLEELNRNHNLDELSVELVQYYKDVEEIRKSFRHVSNKL